VSGTVLVTGGAGFIGSHVVEQLLREGREVRVLDNLHPAAHGGRPPDYLPDDVELVHASVTDADALRRALKGVDAVCHQAAMVGLGTNFEDVVDYVRDNDLGTATLLRELARIGFGGRLVLASSMVVYGEGRYRCREHGPRRPGPRAREDLAAGRYEPACDACGAALLAEPIPESAPTDPRNVYAATKLAQEHLCAAFSREVGVALAALRYHNVYGPRMPRDTPYAGVASIFRSALAAGRAPRVFEDGGQLRDFVHVRDVARANVLALREDAATGTFNIASGQPRSVGEMASELAMASGAGAPAPVTTGEYRLGDVRHVFASPERAMRELGFSAEIGFADGMTEFVGAALRAPARSGPVAT